MRSGDQQAPTPAAAQVGALRAALAFGALLLALAILALAPRAQAQQSDLVQADAPAGDVEQKTPGLDPWNAPVEQLPKWDPNNAPPQLQPRAKRHLEFIQAGVPIEYSSATSPYPQVGKAIAGGAALYSANCKGCHGPKGRGDGDAGLDLVPSPALLSQMMNQQGSVDGYLLWTISEGGKPFGTAMPAFKNHLTEDQIWQIVAFMRAGFPAQE